MNLACACHNAVHLNFGNVSLLLSHQKLSDFSEYIYDAVIRCKHETEDPDVRDIHIPTRDLCILFVVSYNELKKLLGTYGAGAFDVTDRRSVRYEQLNDRQL